MSQIADGTVKFTVRDIRLKSLLDILYPVGSIKITVSSTAPFSDLGFGTWEEVSKGRVLWGADDRHAAGSTIEAGLPNITGHYATMVISDYQKNMVGCFYDSHGEYPELGSCAGTAGNGTAWDVAIDASRCSSIYGKSDTVTPPLTSFISGKGLPKKHKNHRQYHIGKVV